MIPREETIQWRGKAKEQAKKKNLEVKFNFKNIYLFSKAFNYLIKIIHGAIIEN